MPLIGQGAQAVLRFEGKLLLRLPRVYFPSDSCGGNLSKKEGVRLCSTSSLFVVLSTALSTQCPDQCPLDNYESSAWEGLLHAVCDGGMK